MRLTLRIDSQALWARQNITLALMLLALHFALIVDLGSGASRALLLTHFGLFLLWQPVWQGTQRLEPRRVVLLVAGGALLVWWSSWWLIALWFAVLFSLIGGNVPAMRTTRERYASLLAALYLLSMLLVWVVPKLFQSAEFSELAKATVRYGLLLPLVSIPFLHAEVKRDQPRYAIDLVYSVLLFLLIVVLVLGAFFVQSVSHGDYPMALAKTLSGIATLMLILSWLWDPRGGFAGIGQLLTRYFLSLGMPFERWMHSLANLAERESDPRRFLVQAVQEMVELPWLSGIEWSTGNGEGSAGIARGNRTAFTFGVLTLRLYTKWRPSPALKLHMRLLARLLADYHDAKVREEVQRQSAYLQAIYETGSRLTHDVKNLLQSLRSLCAAAESSDSSDAEALRRLIQRQLPQIAQRLQSTLDKLDSRRPTPTEQVSAADWWRALAQRYAHEGVEFTATRLPATARLPGELFDSVADNLLQNALEKRRRSETGRIEAALRADANGCRLSVSDAGSPIPEATARQFFSAPVTSNSGLGVGLYQSARHADELGYTLRLDTNKQGSVRFVLESVSPMQTAA
ncbi:MAG: HAMP domain-containing sensor histidine kinase [Betaproteobacteria bacterium]